MINSNIARKKRPTNKPPYKRKLPLYKKVLSAPAPYQLVKLTYNEPVFFTSTAGASANTMWRINDLYDPYNTGLGRQALFRDQMFTIYRNARCLSASIKVIICSATTQSSPMRVVLSRCESGTADAGVSVASERRPGKSLVYNPQGGSVSMKVAQSCDNYFSYPKGSTLKDFDFVQVSNASLTADKSMWYQIVCADITGGTCTVYASVTIEQIVRFECPLQVPGS